LLSLKEEPRVRGAKPLYVVVVLKSSELSLTALWQSQARLTPREAEVLRWLAQGKTRKEISVILQVSEATVRTHLEHLYAKLGVANKVEAASIALWQQLAESLTSMMPGLSWQTRFGWAFLGDAFQIENRNVQDAWVFVNRLLYSF